ncbi:hypothetical protein BJ973_007271 [Actinoplanes tereljensis]|uniref:Uncharacterized protein n=1 Tax=Paractinoplanes tereljensis TaxID=571912 RepID=A0A919NUM7_9ACTN|nr:hypothetical protein [Actinoplanes tereljensis]GIF25013.1 hypothetical protein Ate02nite_77430 [Actinoplanes tereljensis]
MSPRTLRLIPIGALLLLSACGTPPKPPLKSPPLYVSPSAAPISLNPSAVGIPGVTFPTPTFAAPGPTYPTYTYPTATRTTAAPETVPATPTPSHASRCTGSPTGDQILTLVKEKSAIPTNTTLRVSDGPYCSGDWSFSQVESSGTTADQDPLQVVTTGQDAALALVAAGSEVCTNRVFTTAPPGIRVLACGS